MSKPKYIRFGLKWVAEKIDRGETITARRVDGSTSTLRKGKTMAKKKRAPRDRAPREYKPVGAFAQIERILATAAKLAPGVAASFWVIFADLFAEMIAKWLDSCPDESSERLARRLGRMNRVQRIKFVNEFVQEARLDGDRVRRKDARKMFAAAIEDARKNPKDTAASVRELRGE